MDLLVLRAFVKHASLGEDTPEDYHATRTAVLATFPKLAAWSWKGFKEGLQDEGVPLSGATIGAGLGGMLGRGGGGVTRGAALGYAAGSGVSILRSKLRGEQPSMSRKLLAAGGLGYGMGGGLHALGEHLTQKAKPGALRTLFHGGASPQAGHRLAAGLTEEGLPAIGATLMTARTMAKHHGTQEQQGQPA